MTADEARPSVNGIDGTRMVSLRGGEELEELEELIEEEEGEEERRGGEMARHR
jgi:hypothetical protein